MDAKKLFPFNKTNVYHYDLGYSIEFVELEDLPEIIRNADVTHFGTYEDTVTIYCKG